VLPTKGFAQGVPREGFSLSLSLYVCVCVQVSAPLLCSLAPLSSRRVIVVLFLLLNTDQTARALVEFARFAPTSASTHIFLSPKHQSEGVDFTDILHFIFVKKTFNI
jgi:hypothetical protein